MASTPIESGMRMGKGETFISTELIGSYDSPDVIKITKIKQTEVGI